MPPPGAYSLLIPKAARSFLPFALAVAVASAVGGSLTEMSVHTWYVGLAKPSWNPPASVFGPVWTVLYAAMAIAAWRIYQQEGWAKARAELTLWGVQLVFNTLWSGFFFALRKPLWAAIELVILDILIWATTLRFWRLNRTAGQLMLPYALWSSFALALNIAIWKLNR